jgi:GNAT superfamily N-acetyltransferase
MLWQPSPPPPSLLKYSALTPERFVYFEKADQTLFPEIRCGIIFIMAYWSGPSVQRFAALTKTIARLDQEGLLQLWIVDIDGLPEPPALKGFPLRLSGSGETAWLRDGKLLCSSTWIAWTSKGYEHNTAALLAECKGERPITILPLKEVSTELFRPLLIESLAEGVEFLPRLRYEWDSGKNRFDRPGEILLGAYWGALLVGVCGLNVDPYTTEKEVGRIRHLYVMPNHRRRGIGQQMMGMILGAARRTFRLVRLRTDSKYAARFYERLGFREVSCVDACTHVLNLRE